MFRNIVVPTDLTDRNRPAVEMAAALLGDPGAGGRIVLVHVVETIAGLSMEEEKDFYQRLERNASGHLLGLAAPLREKGIEVEARVVFGPRARTLLEEAEKSEADLMVIQSHRVDERRDEGFGTLSYQLAIFSRCPVLLVK